MNNHIVLLSKDAMCRSYLPIYGNKQWSGKTPNLDELCGKGTRFTNYYTAAPSTAMAYLGMFTQKNTYELDAHDYSPIKDEFKDTIFKKLESIGYESHIIWDENWNKMAKPFSNCYGNAVFHSLENIQQAVGPHFPHEGDLIIDEGKTREVYNKIENEIKKTINIDKLFIWIHLPHVINGRNGYGSDIDCFDNIIGIIRKYFSDDSIYITSDHGNMNGSHGSLGYGFDLYDEAIRIPLITPKINNKDIVTDTVSSVDLFNIISNGEYKNREFIYSDTAYYKQPQRKLAVIQGHYKYIFNKEDKSEELYDIEYDSSERINLVNAKYKDKRRNKIYPIKEMIYYEHWDELHDFLNKARKEKERIWRQESYIESIYWKIRHWAGNYHTKLEEIINKYKSSV